MAGYGISNLFSNLSSAFCYKNMYLDRTSLSLTARDSNELNLNKELAIVG